MPSCQQSSHFRPVLILNVDPYFSILDNDSGNKHVYYDFSDGGSPLRASADFHLPLFPSSTHSLAAAFGRLLDTIDVSTVPQMIQVHHADLDADSLNSCLRLNSPAIMDVA